MGIVDFLRKIGILKSGSGSWSGNIKDQSASDVLGDYYSNDKKEKSAGKNTEENKENKDANAR